MTKKEGSTELRVGIFLAVALAMAALAVLAIGEKSGVFERKTTLYAYFDDISGLVPGAIVRLAGLDVGMVSGIEFPRRLERRQARVALSIKSRFMERVREDSVAVIDSKGLLGDKIINISLGTAEAPVLKDGAVIKTRRAPSLEDLAAKIDEAVSSITDVTTGVATGEAKSDIGRILSSTANILKEVEQGEGFAHRFFYDPKYGEQVEQLLADSRTLVLQLAQAVARIDRTVAAIEHGDGLAHELLYGDSGKQMIADMRQTTANIDAVVREVREGDGLLHALVFEPENARALAELNEASARMNRIMGEVEKGRGTLGGLVVDPSVYEDLKTILGNVERNVLLKALIRFTVKKGGIERPANIGARPVDN
jgi:phospholipid/cholesterol/gamma-HCH transport system substrate-binding protein